MKHAEVKIMIDSGAHSLYHANVYRGKHNYDYYETDEFWEYVDNYSNFIKENKHLIEVYVSVDVIYNPEMSWKVLKYMERKHKLKPLPVFHPGEDMKWLKKYISNYDYVGIGGLGQTSQKGNWIANVGNPAWRMICDKKGMPRVKIHGFAMTSPELIIRYPYYSVDSSSWMQFGKYGLILIPKKRGGKFVFGVTPHIVLVSARKEQKDRADHFDNFSDMVQKHIIEYVESKGMKMGVTEFEYKEPDRNASVLFDDSVGKEIIIEEGVCNSGRMRDTINLHYYLDLEKHIPPWPRPWKMDKGPSSLPV